MRRMRTTPQHRWCIWLSAYTLFTWVGAALLVLTTLLESGENGITQAQSNRA